MSDRILIVRLAGGWDSLNAVVPHREDAYHLARPTLALSPSDLLPLDDRFALHRALAPLVPFLREGTLGIVHAAGLPGQEQRSHFEAWDDADAGGISASATGRPHGGWLARTLASRPGSGASLRAVALMDGPAALLSGAPGAASAAGLEELSLPGSAQDRRTLQTGLERLYALSPLPVAREARRTFRALSALESLSHARRPEGFPDTPFGQRLAEVAGIFQTDIGIEAAAVTLGGFDTHVVQGTGTGWLAGLLGELATGLSAFARALGPRFARTLVLAYSEFGRRVRENAGAGTDHGQGAAVFVLSGALRSGRVHGAWPGLEPANLTGPGDLAPVNDLRDVLSSALGLDAGTHARVFPGHKPGPRLDFEGLAT